MRGYWKSRSSTVARATVVLTLVLVTLLLPDSLVAPLHVVANVPAGGASPAGSGTKTTGPSVRALDGATLDTTIDGQQVAVHLVGIDVPQGNTPCGLLATRLLQTLVRGGLLQLDEDRQVAFTDKHSKKGVNLRVYDVRLRDGRSLAQELVKAGVATVDDAEGEDTHHHHGDETAARTAHTGCLWGGAVPGLPPAPASRLAPKAAHAVTGKGGEDIAAPAPHAAPPAAPAFAATTSYPPNFTQEAVASNLNLPTGFAWLPDGRMVITEKPGVVRVFKEGAVLPTPALDLTARVNDYADHGLLGMAVDPNFASNGYLYLLYTYENDAAAYNGPKTSRLARYTMVGDTASLASEQVLLGTTVGAGCDGFPAGTDCMPSENPSHSIGSVRAAADGTLWVSEGDGASYNLVDDDALRAQSTDSLAGKLLHITAGGQGLASNPFWNGAGGANRSKVWALGFRNPFRFTLRPGTSTPYVGDVGWSTWEEENVGVAGKNYGWPCYEGEAKQGGYADKGPCKTLYAKGVGGSQFGLETWDHLDNGVTVGAAAVGGAFYTGTSYPAQYRGAYFYADYGRSDLRYVTVDANNVATGAPVIFATGAEGPTDIEMGPDGNLYYNSINMGQVRRILSGTQTATATATPASGVAPLAVQFSSAGTVDLYGGTLMYQWDFKDGSPLANTANPTHTYTSNGIYIAQLTVTNSQSQQATAQATVTVGNGGCTLGQYLAQYYTNTNLVGTPAVARCEGAPLDNTLGATANWPPTGVSSTNFSTRWDGQFTFATAGAYTFTATADDGVRVYLDNALVIDHFVDEAPTTYTYTAPNITAGTHTVKVEYYQGSGGATARVSWQAAAAPTATITSPTAALTYKVGDTITYSGSATDPKDGTLTPSRLAWQIILHHCPGGVCHTHYLQQAAGASGTLTVPDHGDDTYLEFQLTATNSAGVTNTATVSVNPVKVAVTLATNPPGLQVGYNGTLYTATGPITFNSVVGSQHTIQVTSPQGNQSFASWSDGGVQQHNITVGASAATFTATLTTPPTITTLSETSGSVAGGQTITINGTGFAGATAVTFDGLPATITHTSATAITVTTPAHAQPAVVDVAVTVAGNTVTQRGAYTYGIVNPQAATRPPVTSTAGISSAPSPHPEATPVGATVVPQPVRH